MKKKISSAAFLFLKLFRDFRVQTSEHWQPLLKGDGGEMGNCSSSPRPSVRPCASVAVAVDRSSRVNVLKYTYSMFQPERLDTHSAIYCNLFLLLRSWSQFKGEYKSLRVSHAVGELLYVVGGGRNSSCLSLLRRSSPSLPIRSSGGSGGGSGGGSLAIAF